MIDNEYLKEMRLMIELKADINYKTNPLVFYGKSLYDFFYSVRDDDAQKTSVLNFISRRGYKNIIQLCIDHKADINAKSNIHNGLTPLAIAIVEGRLGVCQALIEAKADLNTPVIAGNCTSTPLFLALQRRIFSSPVFMKLLLEAGAKIDLRNHNDKSKLTVNSILEENAYANFNDQLKSAIIC